MTASTCWQQTTTQNEAVVSWTLDTEYFRGFNFMTKEFMNIVLC